MTRRLIHYSNMPFADPIESRDQHAVEDDSGYSFYKPWGLWVSCEGDDDWKEWCEAEGFNIDRLACATEVILKPEARILRITTAQGIDDFEAEYHTPSDREHKIFEHVDWGAVSDKYQGIIISPYQWDRRLTNHMWYYSWDCASGCIWDAEAIDRLVPLTEKQEKAA
jgi:hypothetical protein